MRLIDIYSAKAVAVQQNAAAEGRVEYLGEGLSPLRRKRG